MSLFWQITKLTFWQLCRFPPFLGLALLAIVKWPPQERFSPPERMKLQNVWIMVDEVPVDYLHVKADLTCNVAILSKILWDSLGSFFYSDSLRF